MRTVEIKVRGYHLDVFGHVNNARYLEFLEEGRWALFDEGINLEDLAREGFAFNVVNINIDYRQPVFLNDLICVETGLEKIGHRSAILRQTVKRQSGGEVVADAAVTFVMLSLQEKKAAVLEGPLRERILSIFG